MTRSRAKTKVRNMTKHYKDAPCAAQWATAHTATFAEREVPHCTALVAIWTKHLTLTSEGLMDRGEPGYVASRAKMLTYPEDFALACAFIALGELGPRSHGEFHSYALKHRAERWSRLLRLGRQNYVSNGAMIAAALAFGWDVRRDGVNAWLKPPEMPRQATAGLAPPPPVRALGV
jgi:hypothetical protein